MKEIIGDRFGGIQADSIHADSIRADSIRTDSVHADSIRADSIRADSICADSVHADSICADSVHADSIRADSIHADSIHADSIPTQLVGANPSLYPNLKIKVKEPKKELQAALIPVRKTRLWSGLLFSSQTKLWTKASSLQKRKKDFRVIK